MRAYSQGNAEAFLCLYKRYESCLYAFFQRRLPPSKKDLKTDLFQKTWLKIHSSRARFDPTKKFSVWFYTIALNALRDQLDLAYQDNESHPFDDSQIFGHQQGDESKVHLHLDLKRVEKALELLPLNQREALVLSEWEGMTGKEISEILKVSEESVRQLIHRAKSKLRTHFGGENS